MNAGHCYVPRPRAEASSNTGIAATVALVLCLVSACGGSSGSVGPTPPDSNTPPTAQDDRQGVAANTRVAIAVLTNDEDPDGDSLAIARTTSPIHGTVTVSDNGELQYTPPADFIGIDGFSYAVTDGREESGEADVTVLVRPVELTIEAVLADHGRAVSPGFVIDGPEQDAQTGAAVSAGDFDGDGMADLLVSAHRASPGDLLSGQAYQIFGRSSFPPVIDLAEIANGSDVGGIVINGAAKNNLVGRRLHGSGDYTGDGIDDAVLSSINARVDSERPGALFVLFGAGISAGPVQLSEFLVGDGAAGFTLRPIRVDSLASGDFNSDGVDDLIVGDEGAFDDPGEVFIVFGGAEANFGAIVDIERIRAAAPGEDPSGIVLNGIGFGDELGGAVANAGDVNNDGISDFVIGAKSRNDDIGQSYVVFGSNTELSESFDLRQLLAIPGGDGSLGFAMNGVSPGDDSGSAVAGAGDLNGDGVSDVVIAAKDGNNGTGQVYVVFGREGGDFEPEFELSDLLVDTDAELRGFVVNGIEVGEDFGEVVRVASDVNGDGIDDLVIANDATATVMGRVHVIFGRSESFPPIIESSALLAANGGDGSIGFVVTGVALDDGFGSDIAAADVNSDGFTDLIVGSDRASPDGLVLAGQAFVIFGGSYLGDT